MNELKPMGIGVFAPSVGVSYPKIQTYAISDYSDGGGGGEGARPVSDKRGGTDAVQRGAGEKQTERITGYGARNPRHRVDLWPTTMRTFPYRPFCFINLEKYRNR